MGYEDFWGNLDVRRGGDELAEQARKGGEPISEIAKIGGEGLEKFFQAPNFRQIIIDGTPDEIRSFFGTEKWGVVEEVLGKDSAERIKFVLEQRS